MKPNALFPVIWSILHRDIAAQVQIVKRKAQLAFKLDGRRTRWLKHNFEKVYKSKGWFYYFIRLKLK